MNEATRTPVHLWIVGGLSLLWNAFGALDYTMTQTRNATWLSQITPEQRDYVLSSPAWADAAWALGVWGSLAGSVLLLMRRHYAVNAFAVSLVGLAISTVWQLLLSDGIGVMGPSALYINLTVWAILIGLLVYSVKQRAAGVLR